MLQIESADQSKPNQVTVHCLGGPGYSPTIQKVDFASYGTPTGHCTSSADTFSVGSCHANNSQQLIEQHCLGKATCSIDVSNNFFKQDPCHKVTKRLAVDVSCGSHTAAPAQFAVPLEVNLTAWSVKYPYFEGDSSFTSSNPMLNQVWQLCENTLRVTSLDTATDSNTRERLPYEADGFITGQSRLALQREYHWTRHSWRHNIWNPTWPTEWRQTISFFAHTDYMHTGDLELFETFSRTMEAQSQIGCVNKSTQLTDFSSCARATGGINRTPETQLRDIVDWPSNSRDGYVLEPVNTVVSAYLAGNLEALAQLHKAAGVSPLLI